LGEVKLGFTPFWVIGLVVTLFLAALAVVCFLGYDLKTRAGAFQVTRWGQPLDD